MMQKAAEAIIYRWRSELTRQQVKTLVGQIRQGDAEGAMRGLKRILEGNK